MGEDTEGVVSRCPGAGKCPRWDNQAGEYEDKVNATIGCGNCDGNPPIKDALSISDDEIEDLVDETERLISLADCGIKIDWERKDFIYYRLFEYWRGCEKEIERQREFNFQNFIRNFKLF